MPELANGLVFYLVFLLSTTLHEAAHAWAALKGGDPTAYAGGQVTIDPIPHIRREPFGMVILPLIAVVVSGWPLGFASAPYDPQWAERYPRRSAWMSLAGPLANLGLVIVSAIVLTIGLFTGHFVAPDELGFDNVVDAAAGTDSALHIVAYFFEVFFSMNLLLFVFNLMPVPPLDGSGAIMLGMTEKTMRRYQRFLWDNPMLSMIGIFVAWQSFQYVFGPAFIAVVNLLFLPHGIYYG